MFDCLLADLHGVFRGLQSPASDADSLIREGLAFPHSLYSMRVDGATVEETGLGLTNGDVDYHCAYVADTDVPVLWRENGRQAVFNMCGHDGGAFFANPQYVLQRVMDILRDDDLHPIIAVELEFFMRDERQTISELYSLDALSRCSGFFDLLRQAAAAQNIELGNVVSECSGGQFEINLTHKEPQLACLEALLFRRLVRECARKTGRHATFMAKPRGDCPGNGMHMHLSLQTKTGDYIFDERATLESAIAGVLAIMSEATAFFAPFGNSYRRFVENAYMPLCANWGEENRNAAVRIPLSKSSASKRLEWRAPGADANPYLIAAVLLVGVHWGIKNKLTPPPPMKDGEQNPRTWFAALEKLSQATILPHYLESDFLRLYQQVKTSELQRENAHITDYDFACYGHAL